MASCADDDACPPGSLCHESECLAACDTDADCGSSGRCDGRVCLPRTPCADASACGAGEVCACTGYCVAAAGTACRGDLQCTPQEYCDACTGTCTERVLPCGACADASACERRNDVCAPVGPAGLTYCLRGCAGQATCDLLGPGYTCEARGGEQVCVPNANDCEALRGCAGDGDCPADHFCNAELARCQPGCNGNDLVCPNGEVCQGLRCAPPCTEDADCGPGGECREGGRCGVPGGCLTSAECLEPETYCDTTERRCVAGCQVDDDCADGTKECVGNTCRDRGCGGNYQCGFEEVCNLETRGCEAAPGRHCEEGCDPMTEGSCGEGRCLSLQDEEENPIGDYCFEPCQPAPNECPQGYQCVDLEDDMGMVVDRLCLRRCDYNP
jgi:hypothetical protein